MSKQSDRPEIITNANEPQIEKEDVCDEDDSVVLRGVPTTKVFSNKYGEIVIKQSQDMGPYGEEQFVYFPPTYANTIIQAIKNTVKELSES